DGEGRPRPGVQLQLRGLDPLGAPAPTFDLAGSTGHDGILELPGLPAGPLTVMDWGGVPARTWTVEDRPGDTEPAVLAPEK
ncbi:MAG: hypothetical protein HUU06_12545, partial [Planctomycetaceae bacterium]|nr:hypothetical protein [Planctomycetaceae bacterium]